MVPRQHEHIAGIGRHHDTEGSSQRFGLCQRDSHGIARLFHGLAGAGHGGAVECFAHGEKERQFRAHLFDGAQSAMRRAYVERCPQSGQQQGPVVVECPGLLTGGRRCGLLLETLVQRARACGTGKRGRRLVCLVKGRRGFAFPWMPPLAAVAKRVAIISHPQGHVARGPVAGHEAQAPIGGHAKA